MKHFKPEEIARFAEGKIKESEQEFFLKHLAECEECFKAYSDTLKFIEEEYKNKYILKLPDFNEIKIVLHKFWQGIRNLVRLKGSVLVPTFAVLIIILLIGPFMLTEIHNRKIKNAQIQQISRDIEDNHTQVFAPPTYKPFAAVRIGIFIEDLTLVVNTGSNVNLKTKIQDRLNSQLKLFNGKENSLLKELADIEKNNLPVIVQCIPELLGQKSLVQLFRFGRFIERSLFLTIGKKMPLQQDIEKYLSIARKQGLPPGVIYNLEKLKNTKSADHGKKYCFAIKTLFME
jgi:hypothetical protein